MYSQLYMFLIFPMSLKWLDIVLLLSEREFNIKFQLFNKLLDG
jgi:hypothetical protein